MALVGTLGFNFQVILPLLARFSFDGGAGAYAALVCAMAVGAIAGALVTGARARVSPALIAGAALALRRPRAAGRRGADAGAGARRAGRRSAPPASCFAASVNSSLQLAARPEMRGRVMALYSIVFLGSTPIGAPLAGWLSEALDPRAALVMAGVAGIVAGLLARHAFARVASDHAAAAA